jgi:Raf kinase inhibitor-like YbhB/YbcL family protein
MRTVSKYISAAVALIAVAIVLILVFHKTYNMENSTTTTPETLRLTSSVFSEMSVIPDIYTCKGENINPPLNIHDVDPRAKSLVLVLEDPDTPIGMFNHWVKFNIPPETTIIEEGKEPPGVAGVGSSGNLTYKGPCPPSGTHRYFFRIISLDTELPLAEGASKDEVLNASTGHILQEGQLIGLYSK